MLWWIGNIILIVVVVPALVYLLHGVLRTTRGIVPSVRRIETVTAAASADLEHAGLLVTTQDQVARTIAGVAEYGGSLDVIIDDA
jgi:hypothetical protein